VPFKTITPSEAHALLGSDPASVYIDVRSEPEFSAGHPVGARNVPIAHLSGGGMIPNQEFLKVMAAHFQKDTALLVGCKMGGRSARACEILADAGYTNLKNVDGGFDGRGNAADPAVRSGWKGSGLPVTGTAAPGTSWAELRKKA